MESGGLVSAHREIMQTPQLRASLDFALLEYQRRLTGPAYDQIAAAAHFKMSGAMEFVDCLINLAEAHEPTTTKKKEALDYGN